MKLANTKNAKYNENGTIDVYIDHPIYGWIDFTADPNDCEAHGRLIFEEVKDSASAYTEK